MRGNKEFRWKEEHQRAFERIKEYLSNPPMLMPLRKYKPLKLYILTTEDSITSLLAQDNEGGHEQSMFYLSQALQKA